jgi:hypothetical protein
MLLAVDSEQVEDDVGECHRPVVVEHASADASVNV